MIYVWLLILNSFCNLVVFYYFQSYEKLETQLLCCQNFVSKSLNNCI